jgi:hypothetical protein
MKPLGADRWLPVACFLRLMESVKAVINEEISPGSEGAMQMSAEIR